MVLRHCEPIGRRPGAANGFVSGNELFGDFTAVYKDRQVADRPDSLFQAQTTADKPGVGVACTPAARNHAEVRRFKAGIEAGRRRSTQWQTDGRAVQAVLERSGLHCRGRACKAALVACGVAVRRRLSIANRRRWSGRLGLRPGGRSGVVRRYGPVSERDLRARRLGPHELQDLGPGHSEAAGRQKLKQELTQN